MHWTQVGHAWPVLSDPLQAKGSCTQTFNRQLLWTIHFDFAFSAVAVYLAVNWTTCGVLLSYRLIASSSYQNSALKSSTNWKK